MKYIIVLGDGMADEPIGKLGGRTPLQSADTPAMDWLAAHGRCGLLKTVPDGYHPVAKSPICRYWVTTSTGCSRVEARWKRRVWESI